jgi:hypothetical protein
MEGIGLGEEVEEDYGEVLIYMSTAFEEVIDDVMGNGIACINDGRPHWNLKASYNRQFTMNDILFETRTVTDDNDSSTWVYVIGLPVGHMRFTNPNGCSDSEDFLHSDIGKAVTTYMNNQQVNTATVQMASIRLSAAGLPFDVISMIMKYIYPSDADRCKALLADPKWRSVIREEYNEHLEPHLYIVPA